MSFCVVVVKRERISKDLCVILLPPSPLQTYHLTDLVPPAPVQPPKFIIPEGNVIAGLYNVDANNTAPMNVDIEPLVTSFIFRVVHIELNIFAFYWLVRNEYDPVR